MRSKKTVSIVLSVLMTVGFASNVYAQEGNVKGMEVSSVIAIDGTSKEGNSKITKEDAKSIAKKTLGEYFNTTIDDSKYRSNINFTPNYMDVMGGKTYLWEISWNYSDEEKNVNINVAVDASSGRVVNVNNATYFNGQTAAVATLTEDKAKEIGESFLNKINPQEFSQCKLSEGNKFSIMGKRSAAGYNFNYHRIVNGISFKENYLNVGVDSVSGQISSYSFSWNEAQFPAASTDSIIAEENAKQIFKDNLKPVLSYIRSRDPQGKEEETPILKLVYMLDTSKGVKIDAKEGKMLNSDNTNLPVEKIKDLDEAGKKSFKESYKDVQKLEKELDQDSAEKIIKQFVKEIYGEGYETEAINYQDNNYGNGQSVSTWSAQLAKKDAKNQFQGQGSISINSLTGQLMSINKYNPVEKLGTGEATAQSKLTWEQAYDQSIEMVKKYFPDRVKELNTEQRYIKQTQYYNDNLEEDTNYSFRFNRTLNGISYQDDGISIDFNAKTGEIGQVYDTWTQNCKVPATDGVINQNEAQNIFLGKYIPSLAYTIVNTSKDSKNPVMEIKLVYSIADGYQYGQINNIEAFTGKFVDYNGQEIDTSLEAFKAKIKGSPQEKELSILASQGIIDTKNFDASKEITRTELIKMLVNAKGYNSYMANSVEKLKMSYDGMEGDETYKYLQMSVAYGILDNSGTFNGAEKVTKAELSKKLVKLLGYDKLAKAKEIFALSYSDLSDIAADDFGYIAIAKGLELTNDVDNKFNPKEIVTMGDAAASIYKALDSLRNSQSIIR